MDILQLEVALLFQCLGRVVDYYWCIGFGVSVCMSGIGTVSIISSCLTLIQGKIVHSCDNVFLLLVDCWSNWSFSLFSARVRTFITTHAHYTHHASCPDLVYHHLSCIYSQFINTSITLELSTPQLQSLKMQQMNHLFFLY